MCGYCVCVVWHVSVCECVWVFVCVCMCVCVCICIHVYERYSRNMQQNNVRVLPRTAMYMSNIFTDCLGSRFFSDCACPSITVNWVDSPLLTYSVTAFKALQHRTSVENISIRTSLKTTCLMCESPAGVCQLSGVQA